MDSVFIIWNIVSLYCHILHVPSGRKRAWFHALLIIANHPKQIWIECIEPVTFVFSSNIWVAFHNLAMFSLWSIYIIGELLMWHLVWIFPFVFADRLIWSYIYIYIYIYLLSWFKWVITESTHDLMHHSLRQSTGMVLHVLCYRAISDDLNLGLLGVCLQSTVWIFLENCTLLLFPILVVIIQ